MDNSELGNREFESKRRIYAESRIRLTQNLLKYEKWGEEEMDRRAEELAGTAAKVWRCPAGHDGAPDERDSEDMESEYLEGKASDLWDYAKARIAPECGAEFLMRRRYGTFRAVLEGKEQVLCWLVAHKHRLDIVYAKSGAVPESGFVKDVSGVRHLGNGDYKSELRTEDDVDSAVEILKLICKSRSVR